LDAILASPLQHVLPYEAIIEDFTKRLDGFAQLPL